MIAENFLSMINTYRFQQDHYWRNIGNALYTVFNGNNKGLELWKHYTEKSNQFTQEDCENQYHTFIPNRMTIKTLAWFAREDSPKQYRTFYGNSILII